MREMGMREGTKEEQERRGGAIGETAVSYLGDGRSACYCYMTMHSHVSLDRRDAACRRRRGILSIHLQRLISCGGLCTRSFTAFHVQWRRRYAVTPLIHESLQVRMS